MTDREPANIHFGDNGDIELDPDNALRMRHAYVAGILPATSKVGDYIHDVGDAEQWAKIDTDDTSDAARTIRGLIRFALSSEDPLDSHKLLAGLAGLARVPKNPVDYMTLGAVAHEAFVNLGTFDISGIVRNSPSHRIK